MHNFIAKIKMSDLKKETLSKTKYYSKSTWRCVDENNELVLKFGQSRILLSKTQKRNLTSVYLTLWSLGTKILKYCNVSNTFF